MEKKQTAVEWLINELRFPKNGDRVYGLRMSNMTHERFQKALQMEKEQIQDAHYEGQCDNHEGYPKFISEQYYNENYEKETDRS